MASFDVAVEVLLKVEGNGHISNNKDDPGGLTKWGISKRSYPRVDIANLSRSDAIEIYRNDWWPEEYEHITSQDIATKLLCFAVLMDQFDATVCIQRAVRAASGEMIDIDGDFGNQTLTAVNACDPESLLAAFKAEGAAFFRTIKNPKYQKGWQNRAYS